MDCKDCEKRNSCRVPCKAVSDVLYKDNHVMERHFSDRIEVYPQHGFEVHFSELKDQQLEGFSDSNIIPWSSGDNRLRQTTVFTERFFNKVPCRELADRFCVKENTIVCMYARAVEQLEKIIEALDARREGVKAVMPGKFTDDQKYFLLVSVFGFSGAEVAKMFGRDRNRINLKVKHMADKYAAAFSGMTPKEEIPIDDPVMPDKLSREELVKMVDSYSEQGLSKLQAFKRIADRQAEVLGRPVSPRAIDSRYYKTISPARKEPVKSSYEEKTLQEIKEMRRF